MTADGSKPKRRSTRISTQLDVPLPSKQQLALYKPLADLCKRLVLSNPEQHNWARKNKIRVSFDKRKPRPEGWPIGRRVSLIDNVEVIEYNAELVLLWLWERKLTEYSPSMLYQYRNKYNATLGGLSMGLTNFLKEYEVEELIDEIG